MITPPKPKGLEEIKRIVCGFAPTMPHCYEDGAIYSAKEEAFETTIKALSEIGIEGARKGTYKFVATGNGFDSSDIIETVQGFPLAETEKVEIIESLPTLAKIQSLEQRLAEADRIIDIVDMRAVHGNDCQKRLSHNEQECNCYLQPAREYMKGRK